MGTSSNNQRLILSWIPRITGILSMLASVAVVVDIIRTKRLRQSNSQLVLAMTMFDMMTAISWSLSTLPIPQYDEFGYSMNIRHLLSACKIQAFFLQFGYSSIFYNVSLCVFYLLRGESKKAQPWLVGVPAVLGLTLAFAGIPFYDTMTLACHIPVS